MSESLPVQGWNGGVAGCPSGRPGRLPGDQALGDIDELGQHRAVIVQIYHVWDIHCVVHVAQLLCPFELRRSCDEQATLHGSTDLRSQIIVLLHKLSMTCSFCCISYVILCISGVASTQASQMGQKMCFAFLSTTVHCLSHGHKADASALLRLRHGRAHREVHVDDTNGQVCGPPVLCFPPCPDCRIFSLQCGHNL